MKKLLTMMLVMSLLLLVVGCNRTAEEDIYGNVQENDPVDVVDETQQEADTESVETDVTPEVSETTTETKEEPSETDETVAEEVYENGDVTEAVDSELADIESMATTIDDPAFRDTQLDYFDPIYYNLFFGVGNYIDGITEEDMVKFAISYIYQHEYNELKFDTDDFILYVPEKRVEALVLRYFDYEVTGHHSFIEDKVMYENGFYLMPAVDTRWSESLSIGDITATGDFSYEVILILTSEDDQDDHYFKAGVEIRDDRYVLVSYVSAADAEGSPYVEVDVTE